MRTHVLFYAICVYLRIGVSSMSWLYE